MRTFALVAVAACSSPATKPQDAETPSIEMIDPAVVAAGSPDLDLTITGTGFSPDAIVLWDGEIRTATAEAGELHLAVPASDVLFPSFHEIRIVNPGTGHNASNVARFDVVLPNATPQVTLLVPDNISVRATGLDLEIRGNAFAHGAVASWAGHALPTTRIDDGHLHVTIAAGDLAAAGSFDVTVTNPMPGGGESNARTFVVHDAATPAGVLARASVSDAGGDLAQGGGNGAVSATGRYVAFLSNADGVVPSDTNGVPDVFVRDTCIGASACTPSTFPVTVKPDGTFPSSTRAVHASASSDMRYVVFGGTSEEVAGLPAFALVVRDTCIGATGCTPTTYQATPGSASDARGFDISDNGRFVAYVTAAAHDPMDTNNNNDVYVYDTCIGATGCTPAATLVSTAPGGGAGNAGSDQPSISADGRFIAFQSQANNLVAGKTGFLRDVYLRDTCAGVTTACTPSTVRVSVDETGATPAAAATSPSIARDGRFVAFQTTAKLSAADTNTTADIYVRDTCIGATSCTPSNVLVSDGAGDPSLQGPRSLAAGARFVAFRAVGDTMMFRYDAFVRDTCIGVLGCMPGEHAISIPSTGTPDGTVGLQVSIAADGHHAIFESTSTNLVPGDANGQSDLFVSATGF